jgi:two-component system, LuxR family, response regulator FixJ
MDEPCVHVVDDDVSFLAAVSRLLRASGFTVHTHASATDFLARHRDDRSGCVVADLRMPGVDGFALQAALSRTPDPLPILFLTGQGDIASSVRAMRGGAEDFLEKTAPRDELVGAVRRALARDERERETRRHVEALRARFATFTSREQQVLGHVVRGRLNKQIAGDLGIGERTVKVHRRSIMTKLGVRSVAALTRMTQEAGMPIAEEAGFPKMQ